MKYSLLLLVILLPIVSIGQAADTTFNPKVFSEKAISKIEQSINEIEADIEKRMLKTLERLQKQEAKLKKKLSLKDSLAAKQLFNVDDKYDALSTKLKSATNTKGLQEYIPSLDSLTTGFKFLQQAKGLQDKFPKEWTNKIASVNKGVEGLQSKLQQANDVKAFIKERKQQIKEQFEKVGLAKHLKKMNKEVYYYQQQLNEYKALLKEPKKMQQRAITELTKLTVFKDFMKKHSQLASLFRLPDNYGTPQSLAGLQTRASVQGQLQARFAGSGVNPQQYLQQQIAEAQGALNRLKDKVNKFGGGSSDIEMPDFKPNEQKTKSFLKRIEYGANVQSQKTNGLLPVTSDVALTAGYKLNDKSVIGIGAAYKLGWGKGFEHIKITHEGIGLRGYVDVKLKGSIWISGGYEQNYQHAFTKIEDLTVFDAWQTSGLIGMSKKYKIGKKTNNFQLLWDFMSYQQLPRRQPVLFRVGVGF